MINQFQILFVEAYDKYKKGRQTKITLKTKNICEGCEGSEASTEETYQFNENRGNNLRGEIDGNLTNNNQKEEGTQPQKPSHLSQTRIEIEICISKSERLMLVV